MTTPGIARAADWRADPDQPVPFTLTARARAVVQFPPVVCLCGSTRAGIAVWHRASLERTLAGEIVLTIGVNTKDPADVAAAESLGYDMDQAKTGLDELHKRKIDLADYVLVLNVGGYIGDSTRSEIAYATARGKPVTYLEPPDPAECGCGYRDCSGCAGTWACRGCGDGFYGTAPGDRLCPLCHHSPSASAR